MVLRRTSRCRRQSRANSNRAVGPAADDVVSWVNGANNLGLGARFVKDGVILIGGLIVVLAIIIAWIFFPVYQLHGGTYAHGCILNPPQLPVGHNEDLLSAEDIERISKDPRQLEILEGMRKMPRSIPATPHWVGNRYGPPKNYLFAAAVLSVIGYGLLLRSKGVF